LLSSIFQSDKTVRIKSLIPPVGSIKGREEKENYLVDDDDDNSI